MCIRDRLLADRGSLGAPARDASRSAIRRTSAGRGPMSTATDTGTSTRRKSVQRWGGLLLATVLWWALYLLNQPFWDWLVGRVVGLDLTSRLGSGVQFFFLDTVK